MIDTPAISATEEQPTAVIHLTIPRAEIQQVMGPAHQELFSTLAAQGVKPTGAWFSHHFRMDPATFDFEVGVPVSAPITPTGRVTNSQLPAAGRLASLPRERRRYSAWEVGRQSKASGPPDKLVFIGGVARS